jgi:hypothetical protein
LGRVYLLIHFFINLNVKRMKKNFLLLFLMALLPLAGWAAGPDKIGANTVFAIQLLHF